MTGRSQSPPDAAARMQATTRFDLNIVVQAGAGTGKTSLLVERLLIALGLAKVEIDRLAALYFKLSREYLADGVGKPPQS